MNKVVNKKPAFILRLASFAALCAFCMLFTAANAGNPMDLIALYDMGAESAADFEAVRDYISGAFLKEFLRKGDTFHLISFSQTPRLELSRRVEGEGDYRTIIARLFLLYPLAPNSMVENAIRYTERFVNELPSDRPKKLVLFSAKPNLNAEELGAGFGSNTEFYLAKIPESFGTLKSGRDMKLANEKLVETAAPELVREKPAETPAVVAAVPAEIPRYAELPDTAPDLLPAPQSDVVINMAQPQFFDRRRVLFAALSFAALLIIITVTVGFFITREKHIDEEDEDDAGYFAAGDFLDDAVNASDSEAGSEIQEAELSGIEDAEGLLRKANKIADLTEEDTNQAYV